MPADSAERRRWNRRQRCGRRGAELADTIKPRVLLVEPHDDTRLLYASLFEDAGYVVCSVAQGDEALAVAKDRLPDLVIMEVVIPVVDGLSILRALRADAATSDIPAIVVTAMLHYDVPARAQLSGATVVLAKPTPLEGLLLAADDLVEATPRDRMARRHLRRTLMTIRKLAAHMTPDERTRERLGLLIDRLQIAAVAMDDHGNYLAASSGLESLTGFTRAELLKMSIFDAAFGATLPLARARDGLMSSESCVSEMTTINNREGRLVPIHASFATILPGWHAAAFAPSPD